MVATFLSGMRSGSEIGFDAVEAMAPMLKPLLAIAHSPTASRT